VIRRVFWIALGAAVGVLVVRKAGQVAQQYTPQGIAGNLGGGLASLGEGFREFADAVRESASEREEVLRAAVTGDLDGRRVAELLENPASEVDERD